jgi:hypothetical protein
MSDIKPEEVRALRRAVLRLSGQAWGVSVGLLLGLGLFVATLVLVIKGGDNVGAHLGLLATYFPGYRVTTLGALIGFVYGFVLGYALGRIVGFVYNRIAGLAD